MINLIIIDDEERARNLLIQLINQNFLQFNIMSTASNIKDAYFEITQKKPDLILLDIQMSGGNGFDLLEMFEEINFKVIFVTAYEQYAIKAIKFAAIDYLLKPVDVNELKKTLENFERVNQHLQIKQISQLKSELKNKFSSETLIINTIRETYCLQLQQILYCKSDGMYTEFHLDDERVIVASRNIKEYDELLENSGFFRIHKSYLANLCHIININRVSELSVSISNKKTLPLAFRRKVDFIKKWQQG